jgi:hypothetical protein
MKLAVIALIGLSAGALGCASMGQETTMFKGPFGRTQIATTVLAADSGSGNILVQTPDGTFRVFRLQGAASTMLSGYRVGDEILLTFDDRTSGDRVVAVERVSVASTTNAPPRLAVVALPSQVRLGAPLFGTTFGGVGEVGVPAGTVAVAGGFVGPGVVVPGFGSIGSLQPGAITSEQAASLGLDGSDGRVLGPTTASTAGGSFTPGTIVPGVQAGSASAPGKPVITGPFTPGTIAPGVTTDATGKPVITGPFTPGTVAPGVNATPGSSTNFSTVQGSSGSSQGLTIRTPGAGAPVPEPAAAAAAPAGGLGLPGGAFNPPAAGQDATTGQPTAPAAGTDAVARPQGGPANASPRDSGSRPATTPAQPTAPTGRGIGAPANPGAPPTGGTTATSPVGGGNNR